MCHSLKPFSKGQIIHKIIASDYYLLHWSGHCLSLSILNHNPWLGNYLDPRGTHDRLLRPPIEKWWRREPAEEQFMNGNWEHTVALCGANKLFVPTIILNTHPSRRRLFPLQAEPLMRLIVVVNLVILSVCQGSASFPFLTPGQMNDTQVGFRWKHWGCPFIQAKF